MGLLQQKTYGLLNKPTLEVSLSPLKQSSATPQTSFDTNAPITPRFASSQPLTPPTLTGATTLKQGEIKPIEKLKSKIPSGFAGDIARGVIDAPKQIATEAGFFDEENVVKLDRLAQSLISKGTEPSRAYEIAGMDLQRGSLNMEQKKGAEEKYKSLGVKKEEEDALRGSRLTNKFMTALTVANLAPGGGAITKNIGERLAKIALEKDAEIIGKELLGLGVPKDKISTLADVLTGVSKPEVVSDLITGAMTEPKAGLLNKPLPETPTPRTPKELAIGKEKLAKKLEPTPEPVKKVPLSPETLERIEGLKAQKEALENTGFRDLQKFESKTGEFKGELNTNTGTGKFAKEYDTKLREVFQDHDNKFTTDELKERYEDLKRDYKNISDEISDSQKRVRPIETKPETGATSMSQGEAIKSRAPSKYEQDIRSLPDIIQQYPTDVKAKVNILDYMRTPDRVLEKIGFGREAKKVREGYEAYVKELPKNIEKITEWSKRVSPESNEKIFKYLDGQKITLDAEETKVAGEIKDWLKDWATRLKLPADNQISHYITHIFDKELIGKEFDEDLAKLITDRLPGQVYDPFLEKRLGAQGFKQDTWQALDAYVKRATRKVNLDDALEAIRDKAGSTLEMSKIEASQFKYLQRYINNVNMRPTELDNLIDNQLKSIFGYKYGTRPVTAITKLLRQLTFRGMLGLNPASALRNLSQGINTYAKLGEKHTVIGYAKLFSPHARQEIIESGILADNFIQDRALSSTRKAIEKIDKGLFLLFDGAEKINRGAAYLGAKSKALSEGMSEAKAIEYAKKLVRDTQFTFGSVDTPVALQNDIMKTLTQFQTYTVKQIEFLGEMVKDKNFVGLLRYTLSGLAFVYTIGKAFNMTPEQLIPSFRFDTPPSVKLPVEVTKAVLDTPDKYGQDRDLGEKASDIGQSAIGLIPAGSQIKKTIQGEEIIRKGGSFDKGGNLQFEAPTTKAGKIQALLFGKYSGEKAQTYFEKKEGQAEKDLEAIRPFYDDIQRLKKEGKEQEALEMYDTLGERGKEMYQKIKSKAKTEETKKGKEEMLPTFRKIRALKEEGKTEEALNIYNALNDDEKRYYQLLKKQLEEKGELMKPQASNLKKNVLSALGVSTAYAEENLQSMPLLGSKEEKEEEEPFLKSKLGNGQGTYRVRGVEFDERDVKELEAVLYGEVGNRKEKRSLEAQAILNVIINRAKKEGKTIREILSQPKQFQAFGGKQYKLAKEGKGESEKISVIRQVIELAKQGKLKNNIGDSQSYAHLKDDTIHAYKDWNEQKKDLVRIK